MHTKRGMYVIRRQTMKLQIVRDFPPVTRARRVLAVSKYDNLLTKVAAGKVIKLTPDAHEKPRTIEHTIRNAAYRRVKVSIRLHNGSVYIKKAA